MRRFLIIISLLFVTLASWGQTDSVRLGYVVRGIVRDAQTGRALESVHVSVPGRNYASVTNADGEFILKSDRRIDAVLCTFVGYKSQWVAASEYIKVKLVRESIELQEASIISGDPMAIVLAAASRLKETYCPEPELLECFYRETVQKRNRYTYVAEAVARLYREKNDGRFFYNDVSALEKSRLLVSQRKKDTLSVKTQGGPQMALNCDFLKIPALLLAEDELALYRFDMELPAYIGDRLQFVIKLTPNRDAE